MLEIIIPPKRAPASACWKKRALESGVLITGDESHGTEPAAVAGAARLPSTCAPARSNETGADPLTDGDGDGLRASRLHPGGCPTLGDRCTQRWCQRDPRSSTLVRSEPLRGAGSRPGGAVRAAQARGATRARAGSSWLAARLHTEAARNGAGGQAGPSTFRPPHSISDPGHIPAMLAHGLEVGQAQCSPGRTGGGLQGTKPFAKLMVSDRRPGPTWTSVVQTVEPALLFWREVWRWNYPRYATKPA